MVQSLSFLKVLLQSALAEIPSSNTQNGKADGVSGAASVGGGASSHSVKVGEIMSKKLLTLVMKTVMKAPEVEYVAILVDIVNLVINDKE